MIKNLGGVFGRNPTFNNVEVEGDLTVDGSIIGTVAAGGSNTQVQFNNAGVLDANAGLTYDSATETLRVRSHPTRYLTIGPDGAGASEILAYGNRALVLNSVESTVDIGDIGVIGNGTAIQIDDSNALLNINCPNGTITVDSPTVTLTGTTASTSSTTGAVIIAGGVGIAKDSFINSVKAGIGFTGADATNATNTSFGNAASDTATGIQCTAIGNRSLRGNTASNVTGIGYFSADGNSGSGLCAFGGFAGYSNSGNNVTAFGYSAAYDCGGNNNVAVGDSVLSGGPCTGANNTGVGYRSARLITSGADNTCIGYLAGDLITTGTNNCVIGASADVAALGNTNSIVIGKSAVGLGSNTTVIGVTATTETKLFGQLTLDATACISAASATALALKTVVPAGTGVTPTIQVICPSAAFALLNQTTTQPVFNTPQDTISLQASTTYMFEGQYLLQTGTTSHTTTISFVSSVAITSPSIAYTTIASQHSSPNASNNTQTTSFFTAIAGGIVASAATAPNMIISFKGIIRATDAGNLVPNILFSVAPGVGANFVLVGSYLKFYPIGSNTINSVGTAIG